MSAAKQVVHIFGASGSGTTTLGRALAERLGWTHLDTDDFYWLTSDPPFSAKRPVEERLLLINAALDRAGNAVVTGSLAGWGDPLIPRFTLCIRTVIDPALRMERLHRREIERFGARKLPGGDMYRQHQDFLAWAARYEDAPPTQRSRARHDLWQETLPCPVITADTARAAQELAEEIIRTHIQKG